MLTLRPVLEGDDRQDLLRQIAFTEPEPPRRINSAIPRDLETIVLKAIAKEPTERYETAEDLAEDLRRFQDDRPIRARRPTLIERTARLLRRHRSLVAVTTLVTILALTASTVLVSIKQSETTAALAKAKEDNRRAERNLAIARDVVDQLYDELPTTWYSRAPILQDSQSDFLEKAAQLYETLAEINGDSPELRFQGALAWKRIGAIRRSLDQPAQAEIALERALAEFDDLVLDPDHPTKFDRERANATAALAVMKRDLGKFDEGEAVFLSAISLLEELVRDNDLDNELKSFLAHTQNNYGLLLFRSGNDRLEEAERIYRDVLPRKEQIVSVEPDNASHLASLSYTYHDLGDVLWRTGRHGEAIEYLEKAIEIKKQVVKLAPGEREHLSQLAWSHGVLDDMFEGIDEPEKALAARREAFVIRSQLVRRFPSISRYSEKLFSSATLLANRTAEVGALIEADQVLAEAFTAISNSNSGAELVTNAKVEILSRRAELATRMRDSDHGEEAEKRLRNLIEQMRQAVAESPDNPEILRLLTDLFVRLANQHSESGDATTAREYVDAAVTAASDWVEAAAAERRADALWELLWVHAELGGFFEQQNQLDKAHSHFSGQLDVARRYADAVGQGAPRSGPGRKIHALRHLMRICHKQDNMDAALGHWDEVRAIGAELSTVDANWEDVIASLVYVIGDLEPLDVRLEDAGDERDLAAEYDKLLAQTPYEQVQIASALVSVARASAEEGEARRAGATYSEALLILSRTIDERPEDRGLLSQRQSIHARLGAWKEAEADLRRLEKLDPESHWYPTRIALLRLQLGDTTDFQKLCREVLDRFGESDDEALLRKVARLCSVKPNLISPQLVKTVAERAMAKLPSRLNEATLGMAHYRCGEFTQAVDRLQNSLEKYDSNGHIPAMNRLYLAMAYQKQGRIKEALQTFNHAESMIQEFAKGTATDPIRGNWWMHWVICQSLRREAAELLGITIPAPPET